jgi:CHAT domain
MKWERREMKQILILASNPDDTTKLRLDKEVREISQGLQLARRREQFSIMQLWAVQAVDVRRAILNNGPNIVHFCGHGAGIEGIVFENENRQSHLVSAEALAGLFELFADTVECVFLNACSTEPQASAIAKHIKHVLCMKRAIQDEAAIEFTVAFYDALGAGKPYDFAFKFGCVAIQLLGVPEHTIPKLLTKTQDGVIATQFASSPVDEPMRRELSRFNSIFSATKRTGAVVRIYYHDTGLTGEQAMQIKGDLDKEGIPSAVAQHVDPHTPDAIFIGALVSAQEANIVLSKVPYDIRYIFPLDYPKQHGGDPNGLLIGVGYMSTHWKQSVAKEKRPIKITQDQVDSLLETGISNTEFQIRLRNILEAHEIPDATQV